LRGFFTPISKRISLLQILIDVATFPVFVSEDANFSSKADLSQLLTQPVSSIDCVAPKAVTSNHLLADSFRAETPLKSLRSSPTFRSQRRSAVDFGIS
jgi:hypothetical protein